MGYPEPPPVVGQQRPLTEECIDMLSAHVVNADYKTGGTYTIMACMLGLAFYLMQSTILLSKKHSDENPLAYSAFQLKFYCYTTIASLVLWVGIAQMDGWCARRATSLRTPASNLCLGPDCRLASRNAGASLKTQALRSGTRGY